MSPLRTLWILTFQYDLNEVLGWHLAMSGKTLIGSSIALGHTSHDQVLPVLACHADAVTGVDELSVAVPGQLVLLGASYAAGQWYLASHAALHLPRTHHDLQGLCRVRSSEAAFNRRLEYFVLCDQKSETASKASLLSPVLRHHTTDINQPWWLTNSPQALTFHLQPANDLSIAIAIPHLTHICPRVTGLGSLYQQACHTLSEACVGLQRPVVL